MYFCLVQVNGNQTYPSFYIAFVYGPPALFDRDILWDWLIRMSSVLSDSAWLVIGDLNQVVSLQDKKSNSGSSSGIQQFRNCIDNSALIEVIQQGQPFTWTNNRKQDDECLERLDMTFCNLIWTQVFPSSFVQTLPIASSDHSPIILSTEAIFSKSRIIKFENFWYLFPEAYNIINSCWSIPLQGSPCQRVSSKLNKTLSSLLCWSKSRVGNLSSKIKEGEKKLQELSERVSLQGILDIFLNQSINQQKSELEFFYECENSFWEQRAKVKWKLREKEIQNIFIP